MIDQVINVVICYANEDEVVAYAAQLMGQTDCDSIKLIVVINKTGKGEQYLREKLYQTKIDYNLYTPKENLGYLNGLLFGASNYEAISDWYIFSNTDIKLPQPEMIRTFLQGVFAKDENIWIVGPSVYAPLKDSYSNPYIVSRPTKASYAIKNVGMSFPHLYEMLFRMKSKLKKSNNSIPVNSAYVYAVHGSYFFIRREMIEELLTRKDWELLYDEEQYLAEIARNQKKKIYYDSSLFVEHMEGATTGKIEVKRRYARMRKSNKRMLEQFY